MAYKVINPDYEKSPYTGMTRQHWVELGKYILGGVFAHIKDIGDPVLLPREDRTYSYPNDASPDWTRQAECFEGLSRTFLLAAPLLLEEPDLTFHGIRVAAYYKNQILRSFTKGDENYLYDYADRSRITPEAEPFSAYYQNVECASIVVGLTISEGVIWGTYTKREQDTIADFIMSYAKGSTSSNNWRMFNMMMLAFLHRNGYEIDRGIMRDHAQMILAYYAGDGWYRDGHPFDYYCAWTFQYYLPLWNQWYGYENEPLLAARFAEYQNRFVETYPYMFDRKARVTLWGRSSIYRCAAAIPFVTNFFLPHPVMKPGLARRIVSGALLQFFGRDDVYYKGVPRLGFYGLFLPMVQGYSCAASPFWFAQCMLALMLPKNHPFWNAKETNGIWEMGSRDFMRPGKAGLAHETGNMTDMPSAQTKETSSEAAPGSHFETILDKPGIVVTDFPDNGYMEMRTGKILFDKENYNALQCYARLSFHSRYPWEAEEMRADGTKLLEAHVEEAPVTKLHMEQTASAAGETESAGAGTGVVDPVRADTAGADTASACMYRMQVNGSDHWQYGNAIFYAGVHGCVLYRKLIFDFTNPMMTDGNILLADLPLGYGILRIDKMQINHRPMRLTLGSYGFFYDDAKGLKIEEREQGAYRAVILTSGSRRMAMTVYAGFDKLTVQKRSKQSAVEEQSAVIAASAIRRKQYGYEPYILISHVQTREDGVDFTDEELFCIKDIRYADPQGCGGYGPVRIELKSGAGITVDYSGIEGNLQM